MLLEIRDLRKTFADGTKALRGVDLAVKQGEFVVILGPSGSGKTTLLRSINGLVEADSGDVYFETNKLSADTTDLIRQKTGMVFQEFNLVNTLTAQNNVLSGLLGENSSLRSFFLLVHAQSKVTRFELSGTCRPAGKGAHTGRSLVRRAETTGRDCPCHCLCASLVIGR